MQRIEAMTGEIQTDSLPITAELYWNVDDHEMHSCQGQRGEQTETTRT